GLDRREWAQDLAQHPHAAQLIWWQKEFVLTRARALNVDSRKNALIGKSPVEIDFHVAGALELFEDDVVHAAAGIDQRGGDDGERAALFDVARGGKETPRTLQSVGINTAGEHLAGGRRNRVVSAGKTRDGVKQHHDVAFVFDQALGFLQNHFRNLDVALWRFVKRRTDDFTLYCAL